MRPKKKLITQILLACVSASVMGVVWSTSDDCLTQAGNNITKLQSCLTLNNLVKHLREFQNDADINTIIPGTRFMGTDGYEASKNYVIHQLKNAGYDVTLQSVPVMLTYIKKPRVFELLSPNKKQFVDDTEYTPLVGSGEGDVIGDVQTVKNSTGCAMVDFESFSKGNVVLLYEGGCERVVKIKNAVTAGAVGVIFASNSGIYYTGVTPTPADNVPVLYVSSDVANTLTDVMSPGILPKVHIKFDSMKMKTLSENIVAETKGGNPDHVLMVGAHLDSSPGNAGINDNGSAAASVLEIALLMQKINPVNKIRFAWWTGEEMGLLGSTFYVEHLNNSEKAKIAYYLNYEILGAPNGARLIMGAKDGVTPAGSEKITQTYVDYFNQQGLKYFVFDPGMGRAGERSDMYGFMKAGIPVGYLVTGADLPWNPLLSYIFTDLPNRVDGVSMHPCYHKLCDKLTMAPGQLSDPNFDFDLYLQMSKAAAYAVYTYAMNDRN